MLDSSRRCLAWITLLAMLRVGLTALSFPVFGHIDELAHVDMVVKYSDRLTPPDATIRREVMEVFIFHNSPEFLLAPGPDGVAPLPATFDWTAEQRRAHTEATLAQLGAIHNNEAAEGPIYYWVAGLWWRLGRAVGLDPVSAIYWTRLLGALVLGISILLAAAIARRVAPGSTFLTLGVPLLMAAWPQDIFCFVSNDGFNVLLGTLALWGLIRLRPPQQPKSGVVAAAALGLLLGISLVAKVNNFVLVCVAPILLWPNLRAAVTDATCRRPMVALALCTLAPYALWSFVLHAHTGYWFGSAHKAHVLGIARNDLDGMLRHPIWSLVGQWEFWPEIIASSWRGETHWHGVVMRTGWGDATIIAATLACIGASALALLRRRSVLPASIATAALAATAIATAMQFGASFVYDWGANSYPSREFPYAVSGRLNTPIVVLFALVFLAGIARLDARFGPRAKWIALATILATLVGSELQVMFPVLTSPHNFWHLNG